jgi:hypothetical protein
VVVAVGQALAQWLTSKMGKKAAVAVDNGMPCGKGIANPFSNGFKAAGVLSLSTGPPRPRGRFKNRA